MGASPQNTIVVQDVYKSFGKIHAVNGISLNVEAGKILGLLGPNGAGKTTLVRMITTLLRPDSGKISVAGLDVVKYPDRVREIIGLAGQYPAVDELLTGRENLVMVGQLYHFSRAEANARAADLLRRFSLEDAADRIVKTYSGGMRRRLDLAAAIVARPQILLLDEPTTGLDVRTRMALWDFIRQLVSNGATLLLTTQYLEEADALADRIAVIDSGKVIAEGTADELKSRMGNDVLELRLANKNALPQAQQLLEELSRGKPQIEAETRWMRLPVAQGASSLLEAVRRLDGASVGIADISLSRPSLDDVFIALTGKAATVINE